MQDEYKDAASLACMLVQKNVHFFFQSLQVNTSSASLCRSTAITESFSRINPLDTEVILQTDFASALQSQPLSMQVHLEASELHYSFLENALQISSDSLG